MLVVHACWLRGADQLALWGEDSTAPPLPPRRPGRKPQRRPHPFCAGHSDLAAVLGPQAAGSTPTTTTLILPTRGGPVASAELVRDDVIDGVGPITPGQWVVDAVTLSADQALEALEALTDLDDDAVVPGTSILHLRDVVAFATGLVARGRVLPGADVDPPRAVWRPVVTGADAAWARALAMSAPPPLFTAHQGGVKEAPPAADDNSSVWAQMTDCLVDAVARAALGRRALPTGRTGSPAVRAWLAALTGPERDVAAAPADVAEIAAALEEWQRDAVAGPVRACFRLVEPDGDEPGGDDPGGDDPGGDDRVSDTPSWQVRFGLQAADEPSLVVDADTVWRSRGTLTALARQVDTPQETFLAELGKAARLYPELDDALRTARPSTLHLDTTGAHRFLSEVAPAMATAGFGVQLPGWWTRPSSRLGLRMRVSTPGQPGRVDGTGSTLGVDALAEFRYDLAVGGQSLSSDELAALAKATAPMVRLRGQWIEVDAKRLAAGLRLLDRTETAAIGELLRLGLGTMPDTEGLPVEGMDADGWLGDLLSGTVEHRLTALDPPAGFTGQLRPYQSRGLAWLDFLHRCGLGGVLADDMGLGKTVQLLALLAHDAGCGPNLLVCPMSLVGNWQREAARFTPDLRVHVHHGKERATGRRFREAVDATDLVVTTYALAARDATDLRKITWRRVIVDEAQAIKNAATKQATAIRSLPATSRIAVTGTPVENRLADLWSILEFTNPGMLGPASTFKKRYAEPIERFGDDDAAARLRQFTAPFILRRVKTDKSIIADLPEKFEMDVLCNLTTEQASLYQAVVDDMLARIEAAEGIERRGLVLATMTKLKQVCNHPAQFLRDGSRLAGRSGKLEALDEILDEVLAIGERALLFTQYAEFGAMLRGHLVGRFGREVLFLHGGVSKAERDDMVARFQAADPTSPPLFVLSLKAGGTGLTLTAANHVVHVDRWWNPAVEDQATDRAFRIGQRRPVQVRKFVCAGTVEDKIAAMIRDKRGLASRIVGSGEQWLTELTSGQLADLFRLEAQQVME